MSSQARDNPWPTLPADLKPAAETPRVLAEKAGLAAGDRLGAYELLTQLGQGGMGVVFRARHVRLKKDFALKALSPRLARDPDAIARFERETEALGRLEHVNLVRASDAGVENGIPFVVMELLEGADLSALTEQRGPWPIAEACAAAWQAALGLQHAYERGLVHRDIKPSNLWLTPAGIVKVLDMGLARLFDDEGNTPAMTMAGMWMGTPDYIAPEQILDSHSADTRADLYSLGCTLSHLLAGEPPFGNVTHPTLRQKSQGHLHESPPDLRQRRPDVPESLVAVVARLLAKRPEQRYQTPAEVAAALGPFAQGADLASLLGKEGRSVALTPTTPVVQATTVTATPQPLTPSKQRSHLWRWMAAILCLAAGIGLALVLMRRPGEQPRPGSPSPTEPQPPLAEKVAILRLDVKHFPTVRGRRDTSHIGLLGKTAFQTRLDDSVTVEAQLSRPAYAFLIAFRPDGTDEVCFPEKDDEPPPLTDRPRYPSVTKGFNYGLEEGEGLQAFALVVSSQPLPTYREWRSRCAPSPWGKHEAPPGVVFRTDGVEDVQSVSEEDPSGASRGKGKEVKGKTPVARLAEWLRKAPYVEQVAVIAFSVGPMDQN